MGNSSGLVQPWKMQVLIFPNTDFTGNGRHVGGHLPGAKRDLIRQRAQEFFDEDVPALTSGIMHPTHSVATLDVLTSLEEILGENDTLLGFRPRPEDVQAHLDPAFDSVFVFWPAEPTVLGSGGFSGWTWDGGKGQTYTAIAYSDIEFVDRRNVFKHEWGHAILNYFAATGAAPTPKVDNHKPEDYVNINTGLPYVIQDETLPGTPPGPIPNSIYSNNGGFTHDYYSGTTRLIGDPQPLGITLEAWQSGSPTLSPSGDMRLLRRRGMTAADRIPRRPRSLFKAARPGSGRPPAPGGARRPGR